MLLPGEGGVWVHGDEGAVFVRHLDDLDSAVSSIRVAASGYVVGDSTYLLGGQVDTLRLGVDERDFSVMLTAFNYVDPEKTVLRCRLKGRSNDWLELSDGQSVVSFDNFPAGS